MNDFRFRDALLESIEGFCHLSDQQIAMLAQHFTTLVRWNKKMNLTSIHEEREIIRRHYAESLFLASRLPHQGLRIADFGSGAGFPGVPVAVARPDSNVVLVESREKKSVFLKESTRHIPNVRVLCAEARAVREPFDWIVARAVGINKVLREIPRIAPHVALLLGAGDAARMAALKHLRWDAPCVLPWGERRVLLIGHHAAFDPQSGFRQTFHVERSE